MISGADQDGIQVLGNPSSDNLILENVITECGQFGLHVSGSGNLIEGNVLNSNGRALVFLGSNNVYRGNTARGNTGAVSCPVGTAACGGSSDLCTGGTGNSSLGDNFMPAAPCN